MRSMVERPMPVSWLTRYLLTPAATAARTRLSRSRVTVTQSISNSSASSGRMSHTVHVSCETYNLVRVKAAALPGPAGLTVLSQP